MIETEVQCDINWDAASSWETGIAEELKREHALGIRIFADYLEQRAADLKRDKAKSDLAWVMHEMAAQYRAFGEPLPTDSACKALVFYLRGVAAVVQRSLYDSAVSKEVPAMQHHYPESSSYCARCGDPFPPHSSSDGMCDVCQHNKNAEVLANPTSLTGDDFFAQPAKEIQGCPTCYHDHETGRYMPPAPQPPLSACCGADVFEERGRVICEKCRTGCCIR